MLSRIAPVAGVLAMLLACGGALAQAQAPIAAIVIDDLGNVRAEGLRAVELPGPVTYSFLPHTPHAASLARLAHALDKEVLVHLPMEATTHNALGPGGLTAALGRVQFERRVTDALASVPHARGVSNHMGSRLTAMARPMEWLMHLLAARRGWMFLDSRTTPLTVAASTARDSGVRSTSRDVFLDNDISVPAIRAQLYELLAAARRNGTAVGIGHPHPETLQVLREELPMLPSHGVTLTRLSAVERRRALAPVQVAQSSPGQADTTK